MSGHRETLAIDFGTSNTAAGCIGADGARLVALEGSGDTLPTTLFMDFSSRRVLYGNAAIDALIEGRDGRFMRALKSVLGAPLMREKRQFMNERKTLVDIVAEFLAVLKARAEAETGQKFTRVLSGRPVHFRGAGPDRNDKALADLRECYEIAGFQDVEFMAEPEAAARAIDTGGQRRGLVVDVGGGTSDFTVYAGEGSEIEVLASHGLPIGGTDFDRVLSLGHVMGHFGRGSEIRNELGPGRGLMGNAIYGDLATWERIAFVYSPQLLRETKKLHRLAVEPDKLARLVAVLENELGHDVAFAVEAGKIGANDHGRGRVKLGEVERGLSVELTGENLRDDLADFSRSLGDAALECVRMSGLRVEEIDEIVYVGGSSLMDVVKQPVSQVFPDARPEMGAAFTAIVAGLTRSLAV